MNKKINKSLALVLSLVVTGSMFAGCGSEAKDTTTDAPKETTATDASKDTGKKTKLRVLTWSNNATAEATETFNKKFQEKYPDIEVELSVVSSGEYNQVRKNRMMANEVDIFSTQAIPVEVPAYVKNPDPNETHLMIEQGMYLDLSDQHFVKNYKADAIKDAGTYKGKVYGLTTGIVGFNGVFYNKKLFAENNLSVPETWDDYMKLCETLRSKGIEPMTSAGKDGWPFAVSVEGVVSAFETDLPKFSEELYTGTRAYNDEKTLELYKGLSDWTSYMEPGFMGVDYNSVIGRFVSGQAAMLPDGTWQGANIQAADPNFEFGLFPMPGRNKGDVTQLVGKYDLGWAVYGKTENKEAALKWMEMFSEKENYGEFVNKAGFIPTQDGVTVTNKFIEEAIPLTKNFKLAQEIVMFTRKGAGKYAGFNPTFLKIAGGPINDYKELAELAQKDHDSAQH